jgi:hypothetical protein
LLATKTTATVVVRTAPVPLSAARSCQRGERWLWQRWTSPVWLMGESDEYPRSHEASEQEE